MLENILNKMNDIKYGFVDNFLNIYPDNEKNWDISFQNKYYLQDPKQLLQTRYGVCWDQVELERYFLEQENIEYKSYFIINYDGQIFPTHTFIIAKDHKNYYWLEHSWEKYRGIHKYDNFNKCISDIYDKFNNMLKNKYNIDNDDTIIYEYKKPKYNINAQEFFRHCESGIKVKINHP